MTKTYLKFWFNEFYDYCSFIFMYANTNVLVYLVLYTVYSIFKILQMSISRFHSDYRLIITD